MQSIIDDDVEHVCYMCGSQGQTEVHHIFEGCTRRRSDELKLILHLCRMCHNTAHSSKGNEYREYMHTIGQKAYEEKIGSRQEFIKDFIKSYL